MRTYSAQQRLREAIKQSNTFNNNSYTTATTFDTPSGDEPFSESENDLSMLPEEPPLMEPRIYPDPITGEMRSHLVQNESSFMYESVTLDLPEVDIRNSNQSISDNNSSNPSSYPSSNQYSTNTSSSNKSKVSSVKSIDFIPRTYPYSRYWNEKETSPLTKPEVENAISPNTNARRIFGMRRLRRWQSGTIDTETTNDPPQRSSDPPQKSTDTPQRSWSNPLLYSSTLDVPNVCVIRSLSSEPRHSLAPVPNQSVVPDTNSSNVQEEEINQSDNAIEIHVSSVPVDPQNKPKRPLNSYPSLRQWDETSVITFDGPEISWFGRPETRSLSPSHRRKKVSSSCSSSTPSSQLPQRRLPRQRSFRNLDDSVNSFAVQELVPTISERRRFQYYNKSSRSLRRGAYNRSQSHNDSSGGSNLQVTFHEDRNFNHSSSSGSREKGVILVPNPFNDSGQSSLPFDNSESEMEANKKKAIVASNNQNKKSSPGSGSSALVAGSKVSSFQDSHSSSSPHLGIYVVQEEKSKGTDWSRLVVLFSSRKHLLVLTIFSICFMFVIAMITVCATGHCQYDNKMKADDDIKNIFRLKLTNTEQLYQAVDLLLEKRYNFTNSKSGTLRSGPKSTVASNLDIRDGDIRYWDVSVITNFSQVFSVKRNPRLEYFSDDLDLWDVSSGSDFTEMFYGAKHFDGNLSTWDTSNAITMESMFSGATSFKGCISNWDTCKVTNMKGMFHAASDFNCDISLWDLSQVNDLSYMFFNALSFNQNLNQWNVSLVTDQTAMFRNAILFNGDISSWQVSNVRSMKQMFREASSFNGDLSEWNIAKVENTEQMFRFASSFNADISQWNTSRVSNANEMFLGASSFSCDISGWDVTNLVAASRLFAGASTFDQDLCQWAEKLITSNILDNFENLFLGTSCPKDNDPVRSFTNGVSKINVFAACHECSQEQLSSASLAPSFLLPVPLSSDLVNVTNSLTTTEELYEAIDEYLRYHYDSGVGAVPREKTSTEGTGVYDFPIEQWDVSQITNFSDMFSVTRNPLSAFFNNDLSLWDVSNAVTFARAFKGTSKFNGNISTWSVSKCADFSSMFENAESFNIDLSLWNVSKNAQNMSNMFLYSLSFSGENGLSSWDMSGVKSTVGMFEGAMSFKGDVASWDVGNVENFSSMFAFALSFNGDISEWNVTSAVDLQFMFRSASMFNRDVSKWHLSNAVNLGNMFSGALFFNQDLCPWNNQLDPTKIEGTSGMFDATACLNQTAPDFNNTTANSLCRSCFS